VCMVGAMAYRCKRKSISNQRQGVTTRYYGPVLCQWLTPQLFLGDYTLLGMEKEIAVERKTISDLVSSIIARRGDFISKCERLSSFKKKCFVIEGTLGLLKTPYQESGAHPNAVLGSIIAAQERWGIPVYFLDNFLLAEEFVASMLSKHHAYHWLEANGYKRCLIEGDI
jgi:ERCC4-type nuclease